MEKYEKPVMVLEEITDEIHTAVATPEPAPSKVPDIVMVSGELTVTNNNNNNSPFIIYEP